MNIKILTVENAQAGTIALPHQFTEPVRQDLILRAVLSLQAARRHPYASAEMAGMRHSSRVSKRRRDYRGSYGKGISRVARKVHSRRGSQIQWVGAESPGNVGGRRAHPPKITKMWEQKVNRTENRKAIRGALAATMDKTTVARRGHKLPESFPFIVDNAFEQIAKTAQLETALVKLGFAAELERAGVKGIRAGRGKTRGRKHKTRSSFLFVIASRAAPLEKAARNIPGSLVVPVEMLNAEMLAPGAHPGRLTLYTKDAIERLGKEALFTQDYQAPATPRSSKSKTKAPSLRGAKAARPSQQGLGARSAGAPAPARAPRQDPKAAATAQPKTTMKPKTQPTTKTAPAQSKAK